jgi:regulatory protein
MDDHPPTPDLAAARSRRWVGGEKASRRRVGSDEASRRRAGGDPAPGHPEDPLGDPESVARAICLRLLTGQPRTRAELSAALRRQGVPAEATERVLGRFVDVGLIDDRSFAEAWVGSRHAGRGLARRALSAELRRRGVDDRTVAEAVETLDPATEEATARALVRRRLAGTAHLDPPVRARRAVALLARKGYPAGLALRLVREELDGVDDLIDGEADVETD